MVLPTLAAVVLLLGLSGAQLLAAARALDPERTSRPQVAVGERRTAARLTPDPRRLATPGTRPEHR
jgi:hypothetical protein